MGRIVSTLNAWLIRHAESTANCGIYSAKPQEVALTDKGKKQALKIAEQITIEPSLIVVSPFQRAKQTAEPIIERWKNTPVEVWPIQEFIYLSPVQFVTLQRKEQRLLIEKYWDSCDPNSCDGEGAESFLNFVKRLQDFHDRLLAKNGFVVVIGHGQFFKAYELGLQQGFAATSEWMMQFRKQETQQSLAHGEILKFHFR
jgi:probable phosphoglycerate mutase